MKRSLREVMGESVDAYPKTPRKSWVLNWPGQVVIAASTIYWTAEVTKVSYVELEIRIVSLYNPGYNKLKLNHSYSIRPGTIGRRTQKWAILFVFC